MELQNKVVLKELINIVNNALLKEVKDNTVESLMENIYTDIDDILNKNMFVDDFYGTIEESHNGIDDCCCEISFILGEEPKEEYYSIQLDSVKNVNDFKKNIDKLLDFFHNTEKYREDRP